MANRFYTDMKDGSEPNYEMYPEYGYSVERILEWDKINTNKQKSAVLPNNNSGAIPTCEVCGHEMGVRPMWNMYRTAQTGAYEYVCQVWACPVMQMRYKEENKNINKIKQWERTKDSVKAANVAQRKKRSWQRNDRADLRAIAVASLGGKCVKCGCADEYLLHIDHIIPLYKLGKRRLSAPDLYRSILAGYTENLQLLCMDCHVVKTIADNSQ